MRPRLTFEPGIFIIAGLLIFMWATQSGCSTPKKVMKNCVKVGNIVWECEDL